MRIHSSHSYDSWLNCLFLAQRAEWEWLAKHGLTRDKAREHTSDWGTGIGIWQCELKTKTKPRTLHE
jgi:hypothetical protein